MRQSTWLTFMTKAGMKVARRVSRLARIIWRPALNKTAASNPNPTLMFSFPEFLKPQSTTPANQSEYKDNNNSFEKGR